MEPPYGPDAAGGSGVRDGRLHVRQDFRSSTFFFVCSLSGEVGQKVPGVVDAWLQNLCARLRPRVAGLTRVCSLAPHNCGNDPGTATPRSSRSRAARRPSRRFMAEQQIDSRPRRFTQTLCLFIGFLMNIHNFVTSLGF